MTPKKYPPHEILFDKTKIRLIIKISPENIELSMSEICKHHRMFIHTQRKIKRNYLHIT